MATPKRVRAFDPHYQLARNAQPAYPLVMRSFLVTIPAYNAATTLSQLIGKIKESYPGIDILVIDDGSRDNTREIASVSGALMVQHQRNLGKGEALKTGFAYAVANGYNAVITLDADLQHDPAEIRLFLDAYLDDTTIFVGARRLDQSMPFARKVSNSLTSFVSSLFCGVRITDSQSGYRLIPTEVLKSVTLSSSRFDLEPELLIKAARRGYRIRSVTISTIYNAGRSWINPPRDTLRFLFMLTKSLFW
jgi:glycosyltransferase involved in cell wall biosynthesis